jgi:hypothetical protein
LSRIADEIVQDAGEDLGELLARALETKMLISRSVFRRICHDQCITQSKLAEALEIAKLAEEKALGMSRPATEIADKYQQHFYNSVQSSNNQS